MTEEFSISFHGKSRGSRWVMMAPLLALSILGLSAHLAFLFLSHTSPLALVKQQPTIFVQSAAFIAVGVIAIKGKLRRASLDIDENGVRVEVNGKISTYHWADIANVEELPGRSLNNRVRIRVKGQVFYNSDSNILWPEYGISSVKMVELIQAGVRKWGEVNISQNPNTNITESIEVQKASSLRLLNKRFWRSNIILVTAAFAAWAFISRPLMRGYFDDRAFQVRGIQTHGTVSDQYIEYGRGSSKYPYIDYTFSTPDGVIIKGKSMIIGAETNVLKTGAPVPLIYDPLHPTHSALNLNRSHNSKTAYFDLKFELIISAISILFVTALLFAGYTRYRKTRTQITHDQAT